MMSILVRYIFTAALVGMIFPAQALTLPRDAHSGNPFMRWRVPARRSS